MDQLNIAFTSGRSADIRIVTITGPFTLNGIFDFQSLVRQNESPVTIFDLTAVPYMDSAALGAILGFHAACQRENRRYALVGVSERLRTLFRVAGVDGLVVTCASVVEAEGVLTSATT